MMPSSDSLVKSPPAPLDKSISDLHRILGLLDGAAALSGPGSVRTLVLEARASAALVRDRMEQWVAVSQEAKRESGVNMAGKHVGHEGTAPIAGGAR